jgi:hypothetical protein
LETVVFKPISTTLLSKREGECGMKSSSPSLKRNSKSGKKADVPPGTL